jgi:hypothetical protein
MAQTIAITPLNFDTGAVSWSCLDKRAGLEITLGRISGLPARYEPLSAFHGGRALGIIARGMGQDILDGNCKRLIEVCDRERLKILITRSDLPFDSRWYWIGNLKPLFAQAKLGRIHLPISPFLYDTITAQLR